MRAIKLLKTQKISTKTNCLIKMVGPEVITGSI